MGYSITIKNKGNKNLIQNVEEPVIGISGRNNIIFAPTLIGLKPLKDLDDNEAALALKAVVEELDKENNGVFNDEWAYKADIQWYGEEKSEHSHIYKEFLEWQPIKDRLPEGRRELYSDYKKYCGHKTREELRQIGVRFHLYYSAGYTIKYEW